MTWRIFKIFLSHLYLAVLMVFKLLNKLVWINQYWIFPQSTPSKGRKPKVKASPRGPVARKGRQSRRKKSRKTVSDSDDDEDLEDDEPYVPRPSKRRGGGKAAQESDDSDDDKKRKRRREPCQYKKKCYR